MSLIDISQRVSARSGVFPGDTPFSRRLVMSMAEGGSCDVGTMTTTLHVGTHADAPGHFVAGGAGIGEVPLAKYFGPVRVVERISDAPITAEDVARWNPQRGMRYLVKTRRAVDPDVFPEEFAHLAPEAARALAAAGGVAILENLDLGPAAAGPYELMAFPLRFEGADASPVRAVLRTLM